jgi:hypothetical protein
MRRRRCGHPWTPENTYAVTARQPSGRCRICYNERSRRWKRANPEKHREAVRRWQLENPGKVYLHQLRWQLKVRQRVLAQLKEAV